MLEILHCVIDNKFIDGAIDLYETDSSVKNTYVIIQDQCENTIPFKYVNDHRIERITGEKFIVVVNKYDVVILHLSLIHI